MAYSKRTGRLKHLIINADDAGIDSAINRGIGEAFQAGVVTSATVLAMGHAFGEFARFARNNPRLGVGVHLNLSECVPPASSKGVRGAFVEKTVLWARALAGELDSAEVEREFRAQLDRVLDAGITPTHVDGHNHVHVFPPARDALHRMTEDYPFVGVRRRPFEFDFGDGPAEKRDRFRALAGDPFPARTTDCFAGFCLEQNCGVARLIEVLSACPGESLEVMMHPGRCTLDSVPFSADVTREQELAVLIDPALAEWIRAEGIDLVHFGSIAGLGK